MNARGCCWLVIVAMAAMLAGCGYRFAGSGRLPAGVSRVYITVLENRSIESGYESTLTNDLVFEFTRNRKDSLAKNRSSADGILTGTLVSLSIQNVSRASISVAVEQRVVGVMTVQLESPDGRILWSSGTIAERHSYSVVAGDQIATDQNKSAALAVLSLKLAQAAFNQLTDDF